MKYLIRSIHRIEFQAFYFDLDTDGKAEETKKKKKSVVESLVFGGLFSNLLENGF